MSKYYTFVDPFENVGRITEVSIHDMKDPFLKQMSSKMADLKKLLTP